MKLLEALDNPRADWCNTIGHQGMRSLSSLALVEQTDCSADGAGSGVQWRG